jgi:hypothetical protein
VTVFAAFILMSATMPPLSSCSLPKSYALRYEPGNTYSPNVAMTLRLDVTVTVQVLTKMPEQAPPQLTKTDPKFGVAVRVTVVPLV